MAVTDSDRHDLYVAARQVLGERPAGTLMAMLPSVGWADVARVSHVETLRTEMHARIDAMETRLDARIDAQFARTVMANLAIMVALVGLVLAAVALG